MAKNKNKSVLYGNWSGVYSLICKQQ